VLVVEGLVKRFGGFTAVNKVSFRVDQGEILGLIGPNGSGKSTIFNMLSGTLPPSAGSIKFGGAEIAGLAPHRIINRGIGRTFQIPRPFHRLTMFENVALAGYFGQGRNSRAKAEEAAERALAMVGLPADRNCCSPMKVWAGSMTPRWTRRPICCAGSATSLASPSSGSSTSWAC
jgi:branched-chain amino acid transport system ATP-binding protein